MKTAPRLTADQQRLGHAGHGRRRPGSRERSWPSRRTRRRSGRCRAPTRGCRSPRRSAPASVSPSFGPSTPRICSGRLHADEDAEEQRGHFEDRVVVEVVRPPHGAAAQQQRQRRPAPAARPRAGRATDASRCPATAWPGSSSATERITPSSSTAFGHSPPNRSRCVRGLVAARCRAAVSRG